MKKLLFFMLSIAMITIAGCSSSKITASNWNEDQQIAPLHFNKILVVALFDQNNFKMRQQMEQEMVDKLKGEGYDAVASYSVFPDAGFEGITRQKAFRLITDKSIDGVLTIGLVDKTKEKRFVTDPAYRPYGYLPYQMPYYSGRYFYRPYYVPGYYRAGHYQTETNYSFETNLYDVGKGTEIYSIQTESFDPSTINRMAYDYSVSVIRNLKKNKVLG